MACLLASARAYAAVKNWANSGNGSTTTNFSLGSSWTGGLPGNGDDAFMVWNGGNPGHTKTITNAATDVFIANSLSITNISSAATVNILLRGQMFLTNGPGALIFAGSTGGGITLNFSNNVTFNVATFTGQSGNATLTFAAGSVTGSNITFTGNASGVNRFIISAPTVNLSSNLTMSAGDANNTLVISNSTMTVAGRLSVAGNTTDQYFSLTNATMTVSNGVLNTGKIDILNLGSFNVTRDWTNNGVLNIAAGGNVISSTGNVLTNQSNGVITGSGFIKSLLVNQGSMSWGGTISNDFIQTAGTNTLSGNATITGTATLNSGRLNLAGFSLTNGSLVIAGGASGGLLTNSVQNATLKGGVTNAGTVNFAADVYALGPVTNTGTWLLRGAISNELVNAGTFSLMANTINPRVTGGIVNSGSLIFSGTGFVSGAVTNTGSISLNGAISNNYVQTAGSITLNNNGTITGTASVTGGAFDLNGKNYSNALMIVSGTGVLTNNSANASFSGGLSNAATVAVTANTFFKGPVTNTGAFFFQGAISNTLVNSGSFILNNDGTLTVAPVNTGTIDADGKTLTVTPNWANSGSLLLGGGTVAGGNLSNTSAGTVAGFGTVSSVLTNLGVVTATNGELQLSGVASGAGSYRAVAGASAATLTFAGGGSISALFNTNATVRLENVLTNNTVFVNQGTLELAAGTYQSTGNVTNTAGEVIASVGNGTLNAAGVFNSGTIQAASAGTLTVSNLVAQGGTVVIVSGGTLTTTGISALTNFGTISLGGASAILNLRTAALTNLVGGTITGGGIVQNTSQVINQGNIFATSSAAELQFTNANTLGNAGTIGAATGATLTFGTASAIITNFGTISMSGGTLRSGTITNLANGNLTGFGTVSNVVVNLGLITAANGTLVLATGPVQNATINVANNGILSVTPAWTNRGTISIVAGGAVSGGNLTNLASGTVTNFGAINTLLVNQGNTVLGGLINNFQQTSGTNTVSGSGSVTGTATITGGLFDLNGGTYSNGLMIVAGSGVFTNASANATFNGGLTNANVVAVTANTFFNGPVTNTGAIFFQGAISNALVNRGSFNLNNDSTITAAPVNTGTMNVTAGNTLTVAPAWANAGTILVNSGTLAGGTTTNSSTGNITGAGTITSFLVNLGVLNATNGTLTASAGLTNASTGQINLRNTGTLSDGTITNVGVIAAVAGGNIGSVMNAAAGTIQATNGTLVFLQNSINRGTMNVGTVGTAASAKFGVANELILTNASTGVINLFAGTILDKDLFNQGKIVTVNGGGLISNALVNDVGGFIISTNGTLVLTPDLTNLGIVTNSATLIVSNVAAGTLGTVTNAGTIFMSGGTFTASTITNTATIAGFGTLNGTVLNTGNLNVTNGVLNLTSAPTQNGTVNIATNTTLNVTPAWANANSVSINGGVMAGGAMTNNVGASFTGFGTVSNNLVNLGSTMATNGTLNLVSAPSQSGTITVANSATLNVLQAWQNNGTLSLRGGTVAGSTLTNAGAISVTTSSTITPSTLVNSGTIAVSSGQRLIFTGTTFSNAPNAVIQNGSGTIELNSTSANFIMTAGVSSNSFDFSGGTLLFSAASGTKTLTLAGLEQGSAFSATNNNYFIGNLKLAAGTLQLAGDVNRALYVDNLVLASGETLDLAGFNLYYKTSVQTNGVTFLNGTGANLIQLGTGGVYVFLQTSGTQDYDTGSNWDRGNVPNHPSDQVRITTASATSVLVTQNTALASFTIQDLVISNGGGGVSTLLVQRNQTWSNGGTIDSGGKIIVSNNVVLTAPILVNGGTLNNNGTVSGRITVAGGTADGRYTNTGFIVVNSGTLAGFVLNQAAGVISNQAGGTVATTGILTNSGLFVNFGGVSNSVVNSANLDLRGGDIRGLLVNTSVISVTNGTASVSGGITNASAGLINLRSTGTLTGGTITNIGTISAVAGGNIDAAIVNTANGSIQGTNGTLRLGGKLTNLGNINVTNTTWNAVGGITNAATGNIFLRSAGTLNGSVITNLGVIAGVSGGNVGAQVVNAGAGTIYATNKVLNLSGGLVNQNLLLIGNGSDNATAVVGNASSGVFDNSGGRVSFEANNAGLDFASVLIVSNAYVDSATSVMSNTANTAAILNFTSNRIVTNSGTMNFTIDIIKGGPVIDTNLILIVASGSNTFYNQGTVLIAQRDNQSGGGGSYPPAYAVFSNQFVNAGTLIVTNTGANKSRDVFFSVTGGTVTNEATGTMRFVVNGQPATINMTVERGGFVSAGTLTFMDQPSTTTNLTITLSQAGATFSNAPGGQIILGTGNQGTVQFNADNFVNAGTNLLRGGTLRINSHTGGAGYMVNGGTILFSGGALDADFLTNTASGVYKMTVAGQTINNVNTIANFGTIDTDSGTLQNDNVMDLRGGFLSGLLNNSSSGTLFATNGTTTILSGGILNNGNFNLRSAGTLTGGFVTNQSGGVLAAFAGANANSLVVNQSGGVIEATNGFVNFIGNLTNQSGGLINLRGAGTLVVDGPGSTFTNSGTIATVAGGNISNLLVNLSTGFIQATNQTLNAIGGIRNAGTLNIGSGAAVSGGSVTNAAGGTIIGTGFINPFVVNQGFMNFGGTVSNTFLQTAGSFTLSGNATITGGVTINGGTVNFLGNRFTAAQIVVGTGGTLTNSVTGATVSGGVTNAGNVGFLSDVYVLGPVTNTGTWFQRGVISNEVVNSGTFSLFKNSINPRVTGGIVNSGSLNFDNNNAPVVDGSVTNSGSVAFNGTIGGNYVQTGGTLTMTAAGNGTISGIASITTGTIDLAGRTLTNGFMVLSDGAVLTNSVAGASLSGTLSNAATVAVTANTFFKGIVTNTGTFRLMGAVSNNFVNSGVLALNNTSTIAGGALINNSNGRVNVTNGTLRLLNAPTQNGTIDVALNNTLSITPAWANGGSLLLNGGVLDAAATTNAAAGTLRGFGTVSNSVINLGVLTATNGTLTLTGALGQTNTANVASAATLSVGQTWRNSGSLNMLGGTVIGSTLTNAGTISGSGTITPLVINNSGATITASSGGTLNFITAPTNNGTINIDGTLNVVPAWANGAAGIVNLNGGVLTGGTFTVDGTVKGNGTIAANMIVSISETVTVNGGQMNLTALTTMNGGVFVGGPIKNYGTVSGFGTLSDAVSNPGYIRATNGLLYIQILTGNQATGTLEASAGGTLQANGIASWLNNGQVIMSGGTVIGGGITNSSSKVIAGSGTVAANVFNSGAILANTAGQALNFNGSVLVNQSSGIITASTGNSVVNGAFTNSGTLSMIQSLGTFNGTVVNSGAWITDPTTNVFNNTYTVTAGGYIQSSPGDVYIFSNTATTVGNFVNLSTNKTQYDTLEGKFLFANTLGLTQDFYVAGRNMGPGVEQPPPNATNQVMFGNASDPIPGFSNNFALGTLEISDFTTVRVSDAFLGMPGLGTNDGLTAGLYLNNLFMGENSLLIISTNVQIYFLNSNTWSVANIFLEGNPSFNNTYNGIHQLIVVPEPAVLLLWLSGAITTYAARRRLKARSSKLDGKQQALR